MQCRTSTARKKAKTAGFTGMASTTWRRSSYSRPRLTPRLGPWCCASLRLRLVKEILDEPVYPPTAQDA